MPSLLRRGRKRSRGQSLVEFALVAPVLLLVLLIAIDFGRLFLGWITLNNMARVGANYAAMHPEGWRGLGGDPNPAEYNRLMLANMNTTDCPPDSSPLPSPSFGLTRDPGDSVRVDLTCHFRPLTPVISAVVGQSVGVATHSVFTIRQGCLSLCPSGPPSPTPSATVLDNCRTVPSMVSLSVLGARHAWVAAGFLAANFSPASASFDTRTVQSQSVTLPADAGTCPAGKVYFNASVSVALVPLISPPPTPTCLYVPNLKGMTVSEARSAWSMAGFTGTFTPTSQDTMVVTDQVTTPTSQPGDCLEPDTSVAVSYANPPPPPPASPCKVPSFVNTPSGTASASWTQAGFNGANLSFETNGGHQLPYTVKSQTLVGGTYVSCAASITLSWH